MRAAWLCNGRWRRPRVCSALATRWLVAVVVAGFAFGGLARFSRFARFGAPGAFGGGPGCTVIQSHAQRTAGDADFLEVLQQFGRHAFGQVDQAEVVADGQAADVAAVEVGFVGDGADDVFRLRAVAATDVEAVGLLAGFAFVRAFGALLARMRSARGALAMVASVSAHVVAAIGFGRFVRRVLEQQRLVAVGEAGEGGGDFDGRGVVFALVAFDNLAE